MANYMHVWNFMQSVMVARYIASYLNIATHVLNVIQSLHASVS